MEKGEKPQSSVDPIWFLSMKFAARMSCSATSCGDSIRGFSG
jgi:hypothetical protein